MPTAEWIADGVREVLRIAATDPRHAGDVAAWMADKLGGGVPGLCCRRGCPRESTNHRTRVCAEHCGPRGYYNRCSAKGCKRRKTAGVPWCEDHRPQFFTREAA